MVTKADPAYQRQKPQLAIAGNIAEHGSIFIDTRSIDGFVAFKNGKSVAVRRQFEWETGDAGREKGNARKATLRAKCSQWKIGFPVNCLQSGMR